MLFVSLHKFFAELCFLYQKSFLKAGVNTIFKRATAQQVE
jgi:hypothetical protein